MAVVGALGTKVSISPDLPTARTQAGYEALDSRTITPTALASNVFTIPTTDYDSLVTGDAAQISAAIAPLAVDTDYYVIKLATAGSISLAETKEDAIAGTAITITGSWTAETLDVSNWKLLGEATNVDEFGRAYELVTSIALADGATRKVKGSFNNGSIPIECNYDRFDGGQVIAKQAHVSTRVYPVRVQFPDDVDGNDGETLYFTGLVMTANPRIGGTNDMMMLRMQVEVDHHPPVTVEP